MRMGWLSVVLAVSGVLACMAARAEEEWNYQDHLLEYVSMPNGATVDTEFVYKTRPKVYMKFRRDEDATLDIFGTKERIASCFILNLTYNKTGGGYCFYYRYGTKDNLGRSDTCTLGAPNEVVCDESAVCDGALISKTDATTPDETFAANGYPICFPAVSYPAAMSVWYFRVETNGVTTVDMVPCRKDGDVGFYDKVSGRFVAVPGGVGYGDLADDAAFVWTAGADVTVPSGKRVTVTDISAVNACSSVTIEEGGELVLDTDLPPTVPLKGRGRLVKASAATWNLSTDQSVFDGSYVIANGIVRPLVRYALGGEAASDGDIVCDGGTLNVTTNGTSGSYGSKDKQYFRLNMRRLRVRGTGFDNQGALKCNFGISMTRTDFAKRIDLDGDATWNIDSKSGPYFYYSRINLHGHKLTNVSGGGWYLSGSDGSKAMVYGGGEIEQQKGKLVIRAQSYLHNAEYEEPDLGKLTLDRATLSYFDSSETSEASKPIRRPVEVKGASSISATHQFEYPNSATWDGSAILCEAPVNLTEDSKLSVSLGGEFMRYRFAGPVTGTGTLRQANRGELALEGNADTTTFDGALSLESSSMLTFLTIAHPAFMSDWAKLTVSNTFAAVAGSSNAADRAWTRDDILAVANTATLAGSDAAYETSTKYPATIAVDTTAAEDGMYDFPLADDFVREPKLATAYKVVVFSDMHHRDAAREALLKRLAAAGVTTVFLDPSRRLTSADFAAIVRKAGGYVPTRVGLEVDMNGSFVSLHALKGGRYDFTLPRKCAAYNMKTGRREANGEKMTVEMLAGETCWFALSPYDPEPPAVLPSVAVDPKRRGEVLRMFEEREYGVRRVERPDSLRFETAPDVEIMNGTAVHRAVTIHADGPKAQFSFKAHAYLPKGGRNLGAFVLVYLGQRVQKDGFDPDDPWPGRHHFPVKDILARGYAAVMFSNWDVALDDKEKCFSSGVFRAWGPSSEAERTDTDWGAISAWAWGASRVLDWIETQGDFDAKRVAVIGHSRGGKTALWAGVTDTRFALACVNDSGCSGAKLNRMDLPDSEHIARINTAFPHWFCRNHRKNNDREATMDFDQHQLVALMAPRAVAVASATRDDWAGQPGEFASCVFASPAWAPYGKRGLVFDEAMPPPDVPLQQGSVSYHIRTGKHDLAPSDWRHYMDFMERKSAQ